MIMSNDSVTDCLESNSDILSFRLDRARPPSASASASASAVKRANERTNELTKIEFVNFKTLEFFCEKEAVVGKMAILLQTK